MKSVLLPALEFMRTDKNAEPDPVYIKDKLRAQLDLYPDTEIYITQGFICRNAYGEIDNLQRGGSDYTASLIGAAVNASEIRSGQISTVCTITTRVLLTRPLRYASCTSEEAAVVGLTSVQRFCTLLVSSRLNMPISLSAC